MTKTFWMSFCDPEKPSGQQFLGVSVVEVSDAEAAAEKTELDAKFPRHREGAEWMAAATRKAHRLGCNPGGEIGFVEIPSAELHRFLATPRDVLLQKAQLEELGH